MTAGGGVDVHVPAMCSPVPQSDRFSADMGGHGSWSVAFKCPGCARRGRFNKNFLGTRHVVCDGSKFSLVADRFADLRAAGIDFRREAERSSKPISAEESLRVSEFVARTAEHCLCSYVGSNVERCARCISREHLGMPANGRAASLAALENQP